MLQRQPCTVCDVTHVATTGEPLSRTERDARAPGAHAAKDELLAELVVVLAVDHRQAQDGGALRQVRLFDVELVVVLQASSQSAIGIAGGPHRRLLVEGHGVGLAAIVERAECAVDVDAGDDEPPEALGQRRKRSRRVGPCQRAAVDGAVRSERRELRFVLEQLAAIAMKMRTSGHPVRFQRSAVGDEQIVAGRSQLLDDRATDETRAAEDDDSQAGRGSAARGEAGFFSTIMSRSPHSLACSGVMKKSRSMARSTSSSWRPQCFAYRRASCSRWRRISWAWIWMSDAWPWMPCVNGWWMRICECGSAMRSPSAPPASSSEAPLAARPVHSVPTFGPTYCMAS